MNILEIFAMTVVVGVITMVVLHSLGLPEEVVNFATLVVAVCGGVKAATV